MSAEAMLAVLAAGIYLFDCVLLLERGQAALELRGRRCRLAFGNRYYVIRGKPVALLNPFTPYAPVFLTLPLHEGPRGKWKPLARLASGFGLPGALAAAQLVLLFAVIPVLMYRYADWMFLVALAMAYLNAVALLVLLARAYRRQGLAAKGLWGLAFGALVCLPLSVNAMRRASLRITLARNACTLLRLLPRDERAASAAELAGHLDEAIVDYDETSSAAAELTRMRDRLKAVAPGRT